MIPSKKYLCPHNFFSPFSWKMLLSSKRLSDKKIFETSVLIEKVIFIFFARRPARLPFKMMDLTPKNGFFLFSRKIRHLKKKTVK